MKKIVLNGYKYNFGSIFYLPVYDIYKKDIGDGGDYVVYYSAIKKGIHTIRAGGAYCIANDVWFYNTTSDANLEKMGIFKSRIEALRVAKRQVLIAVKRELAIAKDTCDKKNDFIKGLERL